MATGAHLPRAKTWLGPVLGKMVTADRRRALILATALNFLGAPGPSADDDLDAEELSLLERFLERAECRALYAVRVERVRLVGQLVPGQSALVFFKVSEVPLTEQNVSEVVQVASLGRSSAAASLAEAIRLVWGPALQRQGFDSAHLRRLERELTGPRAAAGSLLEEEACMRDQARAAASPQERRLREQALLYLTNIRRELESAAVAREGLLMVEESLDSLSGHLDELWKLKGPIYAEDRMAGLLEIIGAEIARIVESLIAKQSVAGGPDGRAKDEAIAQGALVCQKWIELTKRTTGLFWPHQPSHVWQGKPYVPEKCSNCETRLRELAEIRAQNRQLTRLLTPSERTKLGMDALFEQFDRVEELLGEGHEAEWERLKERVCSGLAPAEERVAAKLKLQITGAGTALGLESEFRRYSELMKREAIKALLRPERQSLLAAYPELIEACQRPGDTSELLDTPEILQEVQAARVAELRLESLRKLGEQLLAELPGYGEVSARLKAAAEAAARERQELAEAWVAETRRAIASEELALGREAAVLELTAGKLMRVNFEPRLARLIREARGLSAQGLELPREVKELVDRASALTARARALERIANFHNTIGDRMVASQRPLMRATALELAAAVREQAGVVWSDPRAVDFFTSRLRDLVMKLARQNGELAARHASLRELVCGLLRADALDLAGNQAAWKEALRAMRAVIGAAEAAAHGDAGPWKLHWERQLLKVLGIAYRAALPRLVRRLPEIRLELTHRDESLQWRPSLEDVRMKLYSGLRRFLVIPANFRGVAEPAEGRFETLVPRSAHLYGAVYREAESLLAALESFRAKWLPLVAPANIDVGQTLKGSQPQDWERAFKEAKQWAQEVGKLRAGEVRMCCVIVDTGTIRSDLESLSRRYWERLRLGLRAEAASRLLAVSDFLAGATRKLSRRARTAGEIGEAREAYASIEAQAGEVGRELEEVGGLGRVLAAWTRERLEGLAGARAAWDGLRERLAGHQGALAHQLEEARLNLGHQLLGLRDEQERWRAKWAARPPAPERDWLEAMRERWTHLGEQRDLLAEDGRRLGAAEMELGPELEAELGAELEAEELACGLRAEFAEELERHEEEEWRVARRRLGKFHDWLDSWGARLRQLGEPAPRATDLAESIRRLGAAAELAQLLRGDELADEHWAELGQLLALPAAGSRPDLLTLGQLLRAADLVEANLERVKDITKRAAAESGVRQALAELEAWEGCTALPVQMARDSKGEGIYLVGDYSALLARAGELRVILEGARGAAGYERFASRASRCEAALSELEERLRLLSVVQRKWIYLDPVYNSEAAPSDSGRWARADKEFRYVMGDVGREPKIPALKKVPLHALASLKDLLDRCQKSLDDYLEEKRLAYPRLYFLSDEDLLELVSGRGLDLHLSKLYQGLGSVVQSPDGHVTSVLSPEGEELRLLGSVSLAASFPEWLASLEAGMRQALERSLADCLGSERWPAVPRLSAYPSQVLLLRQRIRFTESCEAALSAAGQGLVAAEEEREPEVPVAGNKKEPRSRVEKSLRSLLAELASQRELYRGQMEEPGAESLSVLKAKNLLLETVQQIQTVRSLLALVPERQKLPWAWSRQLRSYAATRCSDAAGAGVVVRCAGAEFPYGFEYQGGALGLVRTGLTDKCYLALSQAMRLGLGGCPTGPAGTGKTESVKALAGLLGRRVLVFNCDGAMDAGSMRRILSGLARAGAWGCFDEFNRLEEDTMSAVSMLIGPLQEAVRAGADRALLAGAEVPVDRRCCLFVTMNPAGDEYGGRRKLPDSLARLFRPIGMARPDRRGIVRSLLECAGFAAADDLAARLVEAFDTAERLLPKRAHYDWGLRALRSVLDAIAPAGPTSPAESLRLLAAVKTSTLPKLVEEDVGTFEALLADVFGPRDPGLAAAPEDQEQELRGIIAQLCESQGLHESLVGRCIQLRDQLQSRSGVAVVGPPGSGKSLIIKTLADARTKAGEEPVRQFHIYPGAMSKAKLLGIVDGQTREFKEGLLSSIVSSATRAEQHLWITLNGDVEPDWAEALNSALDDNRILTLPNGVAVKLGSGTRFIFETHKLSNASPATVSRLGIVYLGALAPSTLLGASLPKALLPSKAMSFASSRLGAVAEQALRSTAGQKSAASFLRAALAHLRDAHTEAGCAHALLAALCAQIEDAPSRNELARTVYQLTNTWCPDSGSPCDVLYDKAKDSLDPFAAEDKTMETEDGPIYLSGSMQRGISGTLPWITRGQSVVFRGPDGCGKSSLLSAVLTLMKSQSGESVPVVKTSALYGSKDLIDRLKQSCIKLDSASSGRTYRPKCGSSLMLVIEDLHLAAKDFQELTRQLIQEGGFYEDDLEFARIPLSVLSTADSATELHPRLDSLLASHHLPPLNPRDLAAIVELHLKEALGAEAAQKGWIARVSPGICEAFNEVSADKSDGETWTSRDLLLWIDALKYYPKAESESEVVSQLVDGCRRVFGPKLQARQQRRLEAKIRGGARAVAEAAAGLYVSKGPQPGLVLLAESQWRAELEAAASRRVREGESAVSALASALVPGHLLELAAALSWALGCERRAVLLSGRPGAGRRTAVKLVATVSGRRLVDAGPDRGRAAIKAAVQAAGIDGEPTLLLLEEHHLRDEGLAVLVAALAASGELPGLYAADELSTLTAPLVGLAAAEETPAESGPEQCLYRRIRRQLRLALVVDARDCSAGGRLSRSPLLRQCARASGQCLGAEWWLAADRLAELAGELAGEPDGAGPRRLARGHASAPAAQQAPARFFGLLDKWRELRDGWLGEIEARLASLQAGVDRLGEAGARVAKLEQDATAQRRELEAERGRANAALEQITATMRGATGQRGEMASLKTETERESAELARRKAEIEQELGKVEPLVEQAAQAVAGISAEALAEVRSLRAPPAPVRDVLEGVLRLMGIRDTSWNSMKTFLAKRGVKEEVRSWDARRSSPASLEAVARLVAERPDSFEERTARRASQAAAPLAAWVLANLQYGRILQQVAPLEREQRVLAERLGAAEAQIGELESGLSSVEGKVAQLQEELAAHSRGAAELELRAEATEASLATARALLEKLGAEHRDWQAELGTLAERRERLDVDAADAACLLLYQCPRKEAERRGRALELLVGERERLQWRAQGLPADSGSLVAAARALRGGLVALFLDPAGVASAWLRAHLDEQRLESCRPAEPRFLASVELAVRFGKPLLVEDLGPELPCQLLALLRPGRASLRLGERRLEPQPGFRLFLATRQEALLDALPAEAEAVLVKIALGSGSDSLAERLVEQAILQETPEVEARRREALEREERLTGELEAARTELLGQLGGGGRAQETPQEAQPAGGLLASLELSQAKAREIGRALEESRRDLEAIAERSRAHERLAGFSARLHEAVKSFAALSPLYVFSPEAVASIFLEVERTRGATSGSGEERERALEKAVTSLTLHHCTRAAYRKHRLPMALHLALSLSPVPDEQRSLLLSDGPSACLLAGGSGSEHAVPSYVQPEQRPAVRALLAAVPEMAQKLKPNWTNSTVNIYADDSVSPFEKLLAVQALQPELLHSALSKWACQALGVRELAPAAWTLKQFVEEQEEREKEEEEEARPVLLLLSPGADPEPELRSLALGLAGRGLVAVSLGQGHVAQAEAALETARREGSWLLLSNLQLALNWLPRLEGILRAAGPSGRGRARAAARLWLSTEECAGFYPGLSGLCLKLAYEPPEGLKRNARRSLLQLQQRQPSLEDPRRALLVAWLHGLLQERRKFVPQGWAKPYAWSEADLEAACELAARGGLRADWEAERGLLDVAVYGGLIQDRYDTRMLQAILKHVWSADMYAGRRKLGGALSVPRAASESPLGMIDGLEEADSVQVYFGLPANAHRAWERSAAELALRHLNGISRGSSSSSSSSSSSNSNATGREADKLPARSATELRQAIAGQRQLESATTERPSSEPLERFLAEEASAASRLLRLVGTELEREGSRPSGLPTRTPAAWLSEWPSGPRETLAFVGQLVARQRSLAALGPGPPQGIQLAWFARPDAFLAAFKQHTARETGQAFEKLRLRAQWGRDQYSRDGSWKTSVFVEGLLLTGARIENGTLEEVTASASSVLTAPVCLIAFMTVEDGAEDGAEWGETDLELTSELNALQVPVYADSSRAHLVCSLPVPYVKEQRSIWHQRGISFHLRPN